MPLGPTRDSAIWTYDFLYGKGLRNNQLRMAWTLAIRESGGFPSLTTNGNPGNEPWNNPGDPGSRFDTGLFQINNVNLSAIKSRWGSNVDMRIMLNPNRNYDMFLELSNSLNDLSPWAVQMTNNGYSFDWSQYSVEDQQRDNLRSITESNQATYWNRFPKYDLNKYGVAANGWAILGTGDPRLKTNEVPLGRNVPLYSPTKPKKFHGANLTMRKDVLPLFLAFASDYSACVQDISSGVTLSWQNWGSSYLRSGTGVTFNSRGSGMTAGLGDAVGKFWISNSSGASSKIGRLQALLDSYDLIHWGGPTFLGGKNVGTYNWGNFFLKPDVGVEDVQSKIEALGITNSGVRKSPLSSVPSYV